MVYMHDKWKIRILENIVTTYLLFNRGWTLIRQHKEHVASYHLLYYYHVKDMATPKQNIRNVAITFHQLYVTKL